MSTYIFLRHGESEGVQQNILQGHVDLPLTEAGRVQIGNLAERWKSSQQPFEACGGDQQDHCFYAGYHRNRDRALAIVTFFSNRLRECFDVKREQLYYSK